jgi:hypothetical protein
MSDSSATQLAAVVRGTMTSLDREKRDHVY